jgi:WD40 repeat protein
LADNGRRGLAVSADGQWVAAAAFIEGYVDLWDTRTRLRVARLDADAEPKPRRQFCLDNVLLAVAFSRCGRWLAAGGYTHGQPHTAGLVHVWDLAARRHLVRFFTASGPVGRLTFTPEGHLLTADWFGTVALWEPLEGRAVRGRPTSHSGSVYHGLSVNASGRIVLQREDGVCLWHPDPSQETVLCPARGSSNLAYSDDGRFVAAGRPSGRVDLYDAVTGADVSPPDRHTTHVESIELTADGTVCLACLGSFSEPQAREIVLRDMRSGARPAATPPAEFWRPLALAPAGTRVAGRLGESRLAVWDWASGDVRVHSSFDPQVIAWHPDGQTLLAAAGSGEMVTWHPETGLGRCQPAPRSVPVLDMAVAAGGRAAVLSGEGDLFVWQLDRDEPPRRLAVPPRPSRPDDRCAERPLALAPDGLSVAVTYGDGVVHAGPADGGELRRVYTHPPGEEEAEDGHSVILRYTPAGRLLIAGTCTSLRDGHWWYAHVVTDGRSGEVVWWSPPRPQWATAMALSPDGRSLLTGHEDGTLLVWPLVPGS